jgi:flagellar biosynthesis protein FliQ
MRSNSYTYKDSLMKTTMDYFIRCYVESDKYTLILRLPYLILLLTVGIIISLILDFVVAFVRLPN